MAPTVVDHTLPLLPSVCQPKFLWGTLRFSFARLSHASRSRSHNCFASLFFGHCRMFCGQINEKRNSQPSSKENTNQCITKCIFYMLYISINSSGIQYHPTNNLLKGFWRTTKEQKEQGKCSFRALISVVPNSFSSCFHALTISLSQYITHLLIILTNSTFRALIRRPIASNKTLRFLCAKYKPQCFKSWSFKLSSDHSNSNLAYPW